MVTFTAPSDSRRRGPIFFCGGGVWRAECIFRRRRRHRKICGGSATGAAQASSRTVPTSGVHLSSSFVASSALVKKLSMVTLYPRPKYGSISVRTTCALRETTLSSYLPRYGFTFSLYNFTFFRTFHNFVIHHEQFLIRHIIHVCSRWDDGKRWSCRR